MYIYRERDRDREIDRGTEKDEERGRKIKRGERDKCLVWFGLIGFYGLSTIVGY